MSNLTWILTGGFASGYRTYILAGVAFITVASKYAIGDIGLSDFLQQGALALGLGTLRAGVGQ